MLSFCWEGTRVGLVWAAALGFGLPSVVPVESDGTYKKPETADQVSLVLALASSNSHQVESACGYRGFNPQSDTYESLTSGQKDEFTAKSEAFKAVRTFLVKKTTQFWSNYEKKGHTKLLEGKVHAALAYSYLPVFACLSTCLSVCLSSHTSQWLHACLSISLSVDPYLPGFARLSVHLSTYRFTPP